MAKYNVTGTCGHTYEISLYGKHEQRDRDLVRKAAELCPDCYKAAKRAETEQAGIIAEIISGKSEIIIKLSGNTYPSKDGIRTLGYKWDSASRTWTKHINDLTDQAKADACFTALDTELRTLDAKYTYHNAGRPYHWDTAAHKFIPA